VPGQRPGGAVDLHDFPAEHWVHLRTTNAIESVFSTLRHGIDRTKGCVSRASLFGLIFKLARSAENSFKRLLAFDRLAICRLQRRHGLHCFHAF